jgi:hypothetical protein
MIKGQRYTVESGVDKCQMIREWQNEDGQWQQDNPIDIRGEHIIKTDPEGSRSDLEIIKTKLPQHLLDDLTNLKNFIEKAKEAEQVFKDTGF